ncbi:hypothetical protein HNP52_001859 [Sphingomonas kyeonggiensis]|uniref:Uncharacterized protein n=1 Tax=Sphingomonas kyeonggiensis TaxID=1268553 RepID=A0A7W7NR13_9SPHN|nr:hypothetical protein [Sphingomonas kyeonggiensis]MBB4838790.1 hypothetical protein [Sphingomonas kyeonggiensis]
MDGFPRISRPCPVADRLDEVMDGDFCRQCSKRVLDLDRLGAPQRLRMLAGAREELCVSYRRPVAKAAIVAAALAAGVAALPAAAQEAPATQAAPADASMDEIVVGGIPILTPAQRARAEREARRIERQEKAAARRAEREKKQAEGPAG